MELTTLVIIAFIILLVLIAIKFLTSRKNNSADLDSDGFMSSIGEQPGNATNPVQRTRKGTVLGVGGTYTFGDGVSVSMTGVNTYDGVYLDITNGSNQQLQIEPNQWSYRDQQGNNKNFGQGINMIYVNPGSSLNLTLPTNSDTISEFSLNRWQVRDQARWRV